MEQYFVLSLGPDGPRLVAMDKALLLKRLDGDFWGTDPTFLNHIPGTAMDLTEYEGVMIIKGTVVQPRTKKVVVAHDID